ncbi:hypothetical protein [Halomarina litorea]|nr:hypothetical protein [Halomarina sp. BCD28]
MTRLRPVGVLVALGALGLLARRSAEDEPSGMEIPVSTETVDS